MLESRSFNIYKNAAIPMIAMLGYLELEIEILDVGMKTAESNNCRKVSRNNRDANGVLAAT